MTTLAASRAPSPWVSPFTLGLGVAAGLAGLVTLAAPSVRLPILALVFVAAAVFDVRTLRIPNWLTAAAALFALLTAGGAWQGMLLGALVAAFAGGVLLLLARGGFGMGDVKLLAVAGATTGMQAIPLLLFATAVAGGGIALVAILALRDGRRVIPYGPAIAAGALVAMLSTT